MKSTVGVLLLLSMVAVAFAYVIDDINFDGENLELNERELQDRNVVEPAKQNAAGSSKASCPTVCVKISISRICVRRFLRICVRRVNVETCVSWAPKCQSKRSAQDSAQVRSTTDSKQWKRTVSDEDLVVPDKENQEAVAAMMEAESSEVFRDLYDEKVAKVEKYGLSASKLGVDAVPTKDKLDTVVITLTDGRRFEIIQGRELSENKSTAMLVAAEITDVWELVESKDIQFSTVADFVRASDSSNSSKEAVEKMMALD